MNFKELPDNKKQELAKLLFQPLNSPQELKDWVMFFLGLDMPIGTVDPDSNASPIDAMWEIYKTIKDNTADEIPGYIMLSARECYKTLGASILEALLMLHFEVTIAHMAAIQSQSAKAIQYINLFFNKLAPLMETAGWVNTSQNKGKIEFRTPNGDDVYIRVIVCTLGGANSEHTTLMFVDEIDVVKDPMAYEEAKLIPGYAKGRHPLTVKLSTRKFSFGLMQQEIDKAPIAGDKIVRWNIIDVTERCPPERHKPELPKEERYITKALPPKSLSQEEFDELPEAEKTKWEKITAHGGCVTCPLLGVCRTRLADRPPEATGGLYKPIKAVINTFRKTNPDMGEAQLMCWKPSSKGLVYPRFDSTVSKDDKLNTNVITLEKAMTTLLGGEEMEKTARELGIQLKKKVSEIDLLHVMQTLGIRFYAGVDWGYTHDFVIVVFAMIPNGEIWVVDLYMAPGLEFQDMLAIAINYRDKYKIEKWWCDQAMPSHIKSFNKNGMKSPSFTKDVMGGIEALRSKIVDGGGRRWLKVLYTENGMKAINAFVKHHFKLDGAGNPTLEPDDTPGIADPADAMRYIGQNMFPVKGPQKPGVTWTGPDGKPIDGSTPEGREELAKRLQHQNQMRQEISNALQGGNETQQGGNGRKGGFHWNF
jgi:hypothetical protein